MRRRSSGVASATNSAIIGVSTQPGETALTAIPCAARSTAIDLATELIAALAAL